MLPYFIEALVLNGLLVWNDLEIISEAFERASNSEPKIDTSYFKETMDLFKRVLGSHRPMSLKNMCRIFVKNSIQNFSIPTVEALPISDRDKEFLLFLRDLEKCFNDNIKSL